MAVCVCWCVLLSAQESFRKQHSPPLWVSVRQIAVATRLCPITQSLRLSRLSSGAGGGARCFCLTTNTTQIYVYTHICVYVDIILESQNFPFIASSLSNIPTKSIPTATFVVALCQVFPLTLSLYSLAPNPRTEIGKSTFESEKFALCGNKRLIIFSTIVNTQLFELFGHQSNR